VALGRRALPVRFGTLAAAMLAVLSPAALAQSTTPGCVTDRYGSVQCPPPGGACLTDIHGEVRCSPEDGGILLDRYKNAACGPGQCVVDSFGEVMCSSVGRGYAALDRSGEAVCTEGCVRGAPDACIQPSKQPRQ
jgi:hypothetical protein